MAAKVRRTQGERSADTRARLLQATVECLIERGYARTSGPEIAERAGLSRGAQLHHFPTKEELVLAACEHLFNQRLDQFRAAFLSLPAESDRGAAAIDLLWSIVGGDTFYAWLELAVAGRTDATLGRRVRALGVRIENEVQRTFHELFPAPATPNPFYDVAAKFAFALLQGLAVDRLLLTQPRVREDDVLRAMKMLTAFAFPPGGTT